MSEKSRRNDIDPQTKCVGQFLCESCYAQQLITETWNKVDQQIEIAVLTRVTPCNRAKHPEVRGTVTRQDLSHLRPVLHEGSPDSQSS